MDRATFNFAEMDVIEALPTPEVGLEGREVFDRLRGATIVRMGGNGDRSITIEGGGLILDYVESGTPVVQRIVFEFNENGMWILYDSKG